MTRPRIGLSQSLIWYDSNLFVGQEVLELFTLITQDGYLERDRLSLRTRSVYNDHESIERER